MAVHRIHSDSTSADGAIAPAQVSARAIKKPVRGPTRVARSAPASRMRVWSCSQVCWLRVGASGPVSQASMLAGWAPTFTSHHCFRVQDMWPHGMWKVATAPADSSGVVPRLCDEAMRYACSQLRPELMISMTSVRAHLHKRIHGLEGGCALCCHAAHHGAKLETRGSGRSVSSLCAVHVALRGWHWMGRHLMSGRAVQTQGSLTGSAML